MQIEPVSGAILRYDKKFVREAFGVPDIINLTLQVGGQVGVSLFSAWLYDKLKDRASKLKVKDNYVPIDKKEIDQAFTVAVRETVGASVNVAQNPPTSERDIVYELARKYATEVLRNDLAPVLFHLGQDDWKAILGEQLPGGNQRSVTLRINPKTRSVQRT